MINTRVLNIAEWVTSMKDATPTEWASVNGDFSKRKEIVETCKQLATAAYQYQSRLALEMLHQTLATIYTEDFSAVQLHKVNCESQPVFRDISAIFEEAMLNEELNAIQDAQIDDYPENGEAYVKWLKKSISQHTSSIHPFYNNFLVQHATRDDIAFYLAQETNLDPRFDDILALMQIGTEVGQKLEIAKNYFDEMGNGELNLVHSRQFNAALQALDVNEAFIAGNMLLDARISGNISACLVLSRRHYFKAIGYFGVTEYMTPRRFKHVVEAWRRNRLPPEGVIYHDSHIIIDVQHANGWFNNVVAPLVSSDPAIGREIAIGAMLRLNSSERYLDALLTSLESRRSALAA